MCYRIAYSLDYVAAEVGRKTAARETAIEAWTLVQYLGLGYGWPVITDPSGQVISWFELRARAFREGGQGAIESGSSTRRRAT